MNKTALLSLGMFSVVLAINACRAPQYKQPELSLEDAYRNQEDTLAQDSSIAKMSYTDFFKDPVLIKLLDRAMERNNDLKIALKQIEIAAEGNKQAKWLYAPIVSANIANASVSRPSNNSTNGMSVYQSTGKRYVEDYTTSVNISWEADIWGKIKAQKQEALIDLLKTKEAANAVKTRLVTEVVQGYYNLLMLDKQLAISKENLGFADSTLLILDKQLELGLITSLAVQQQEITRDQIAKSIPQLESAIQVQENALHIFTGDMPSAIERNIGLDEAVLPDNLSTGVPAALLSYRPDVRSSELDIRKSLATVHVDRVSMYPGLNITAQGGLNAFKAENWFKIPGSLFGTAAGSLVQPILQGRQLKTKLEQSKLMSEQAELSFKQTVLKAVGEVSDALVQMEKLDEQLVIAENMVTKSGELVNNSLTLYKYNEATYLEVIVAQTNKLQAELDLANVKAQKLLAVTSLYRSLGGGWL